MSNISIKIKGFDSQEFPKGITPLQIMNDIKGVPKDTIICKVDGQLTDLSSNLHKNCELQFMDAKSKDGHSVLLHSTAHLMAQASKDYFQKLKLQLDHF